MAIKIQHSIRTLRLKVKTEGYAWLEKAAIVSGNESSLSVAEPSRPYLRWEAEISAVKAAA
jgi:hypothetical protein